MNSLGKLRRQRLPHEFIQPIHNKEHSLSRYAGPRLKILRALGTELPGLSRKSPAERNRPPGQHGRKQKHTSDFGIELIETQKLRYSNFPRATPRRASLPWPMPSSTTFA